MFGLEVNLTTQAAKLPLPTQKKCSTSSVGSVRGESGLPPSGMGASFSGLRHYTITPL